MKREKKQTNKSEKRELDPAQCWRREKLRRNFTSSTFIWWMMRANYFRTFEWTLTPSKLFCQIWRRKHLRQTQPSEKPSLLDKKLIVWLRYLHVALTPLTVRSRSALNIFWMIVAWAWAERERTLSDSVYVTTEIHVIIANHSSTLSRWTLLYHLRTVTASQTTATLKITTDNKDDGYTHNQCMQNRMEKDDSVKGRITVSSKRHSVFQDGGDTLKNITSQDVVTLKTEESMLIAENLGRTQIKVFDDKHLCEPPDQHLDLKSPVRKNKTKTFTHLDEVVPPSKGKENIINVNRSILQRFITAYRVGCKVNL